MFFYLHPYIKIPINLEKNDKTQNNKTIENTKIENDKNENIKVIGWMMIVLKTKPMIAIHNLRL